MFGRIKETIDKGATFLVTTHADPDGDAIGSAFAVCFALTGMGKEAAVYLKDPVPYRYAFLPRPPTVLHKMPEKDYDAVFVVDCGNLDRVGDGREVIAHKGLLINIDHHEANEAFGQINIVDERASSAAELLYLIFKSTGVPLTYEIAANIYTAILTDTGSFCYESTTKRAFSICEEMTDLGVRPAYVASAVYESHPKERYNLLCLVLATMETHREDKVATAYVSQEMFSRDGHKPRALGGVRRVPQGNRERRGRLPHPRAGRGQIQGKHKVERRSRCGIRGALLRRRRPSQRGGLRNRRTDRFDKEPFGRGIYFMINGFLILDKSPGMTSYDAIKRLKRLHAFKKIGYIGTLDRNATGILPVAMDEGVKLIPFLENGEKRYVAKFVLGITTDTFDMEGTVLSDTQPPAFEREVVEEALSRFKGRITQKIPVYSSKKVEGKPLYKWVRQGLADRPPEQGGRGIRHNLS